jgi:hypothetical protein
MHVAIFEWNKKSVRADTLFFSQNMFESAIREAFGFRSGMNLVPYGESYSRSEGSECELQLILLFATPSRFTISVERRKPSEDNNSQALAHFAFRGSSVIRTRAGSLSEFFHKRKTLADTTHDIVDYQEPEALVRYLKELLQLMEKELALLVDKHTLERRLFFGSEPHFGLILKWLRTTWGPGTESLNQRYCLERRFSGRVFALCISLSRQATFDAMYSLNFDFASRGWYAGFCCLKFNKTEIHARYVPRRRDSPSELFTPAEGDFTELNCAMGSPEELLALCKQLYSDSVVPQLEQLFCRTPLVLNV